MFYKEITVKCEGGIRSHKAAQFVQEASNYESQMLIESENKKINAKSIMGVLSLKIAQGDTFTISANGRDEKEAVEAIEKIVSC